MVFAHFRFIFHKGIHAVAYVCCRCRLPVSVTSISESPSLVYFNLTAGALQRAKYCSGGTAFVVRTVSMVEISDFPSDPLLR